MNVPLLAIGIILLVVVPPSLYLWNRYQVHRMADAFLERADGLEKNKDWRGAAAEISQYLQLRPDDTKARVRLAETFDRAARDGASKDRAIQFYNEALGSDLDGAYKGDAQGKRLSLQRRLSELHLELGQMLLSVEQVQRAASHFALAETGANDVLGVARNDPDPEAWRCLVLARYGRYKSGDLTRHTDQQDVGARLEQAWSLKPGDIELSRDLADIYRGQRELLAPGQSHLEDTDLKKLANSGKEDDLKELADRVIQRMVQANPQSAEARVAQYDYCVNYQLPDAAQALQAAIKLAPDDAEVVLRAAKHAQREAERMQARAGSPAGVQAKLEEAQNQYKRLVLLAPAREQGYLGLGDIQALRGSLDDAVKTWQTGLENSGRESIQLNASLAEAYLQTGDLAKAEETLTALEHAVDRFTSSRPKPSRTRQLRHSCDVLRARLLLQKDQPLEAVDLLQRAMAAQETGAAAGNPAENWLLLAQGLVRKQAGLPKQARNWEEPRKALRQATELAKKNPPRDPWRLNLVAAELDVRLGEHEGKAKAEVARDVAKQLQQAEKAFPDSEPLLQSLVSFYEGLGLPADADRIVEQLDKVSKKSVNSYLVRARLLAIRKEFDKAAQVLDAGLKTLPKDASKPLREALAQLYLAQGKLPEARKELRELFDQDRANLNLARQLAELALAGGDLADLQHWEDVLRGVEGDDGASWRYFKAHRLLQQAKDAKDPLLKEAEDLQGELARRRPSWPLVYVLRAQIEERRGNLAAAVDAYKETIRLGDQRAELFARLIAALLQLQRYAEAEAYTRQMGEVASFSPSMASLEAWTAERLGQLDRALEAAQRAVKVRPKDPAARIKLAQLLLANKRSKEAEETLRGAVQVAPTAPGVYTALFGFYLQNKDSERAGQVLADLEKLEGQEGLTASQRAELALTVAQGYAALGNQQKSQAKFDEARRLAPTSELAERFAAGLLPGNLAEAEKCLRRALELDPQSATARRRLADVLAARGGEREWQESLQLLESAGEDKGSPGANRRLQVRFLVQRGGKENLLKARQILEPLVADPKEAAPGDRLLLAQVYESEGNLKAADSQYVALATRADPLPAHLAAYVDFLLRHERAQDADRWMAVLQKSAPEDLNVAGLHARWLLARGRTAEIEPLVEGLAKKLEVQAEKDSKLKASLYLNVANLYSSVKQHGAAERWYRRLQAASAEAYGPLAGCLARQGKMDEAVSLWLAASKSDPSSRTAIALAALLLAGRPDAKAFERAEPTLAAALASHKDDAVLLASVATVRLAQKRPDDASKLLRQVLQLQPKNVTALNNLAAILGEQPQKQEEALRYVNQAIEILGPQPQLLDTKAMIYLFAGKPEEAARLLEEVVLTPNPDPRYLFHLAAAYYRKNDLDKFRAAMAKVRLDDLATTLLTEADEKLLAEIRSKSGS